MKFSFSDDTRFLAAGLTFMTSAAMVSLVTCANFNLEIFEWSIVAIRLFSAGSLTSMELLASTALLAIPLGISYYFTWGLRTAVKCGVIQKT